MYRKDERGTSTVLRQGACGLNRSAWDLVRHELASQRLTERPCIPFVVGSAVAASDSSNAILPYGRLRGCKSNTMGSRLSNLQIPQARPFGTSDRPCISAFRMNTLMFGLA